MSLLLISCISWLASQLRTAQTPPPSATAVTRAKNSVVIFDEHAAARAPLYFYLARRGLARVVAKCLMEASGASR